MCEPWPRLLAATLLASFALAPPAAAQAGLGHVEDASTPPRGLMRLRMMTAWTRYDSRFVASGVEPLGAPYTADSLGARQVPPLSSIQSLVQSATGSPFTLMLGRSRLDVTAREEIVPLALEYGLSNRVAVGLLVPIVRKRAAMLFRLDTTGSAANVGPNPARASAAAAQMDRQIQVEFAMAASQLQAKLQSCQSNPSGPGCPTLLARQNDAQQLIQSSQTFAGALAALYGSASSSGMAFVPTNLSTAHVAIASRISDFNARYRDLLSSSADVITSRPSAAGGPAGVAEFQQYLVGDLNSDSLSMQERVGVGDVEVGLKVRLVDHGGRPSERERVQLAIGSSVRLPTGSRLSKSSLVDLRLGEGEVILDSRAVLDAQIGRLGILASGQFAAAVHRNDTASTPQHNSTWTAVDVAPRWHLSSPFALYGAYSLRFSDKLGNDQLAGGGVSYSTLQDYTHNSRSLPIEMRYTHLEAVNGSAGRPKFFREQIEVRVYFQPR